MSTLHLRERAVVRPASESDFDSLLGLHRWGFGSDWSQQDWSHRYAAHPAGQGTAVGAFTPSGECLAAFCGVLLPCRVRGERAVICRAGDVVVHPDLRRNAAGPRLLLKVCSGFVDHVSGKVCAIFGFPEPGLSRTLIRHCRYEVMGDITWLAKDIYDCPAASSTRSVSSARDFDALQPLLDRHSQLNPTGLVRDAEYLRWRYESHPRHDYTFLTVVDANLDPRGFAVVHAESMHPQAVMINELLGEPGDEQTINCLLAAIAEIARAHGRSTIVTCFSGNSDEFAAMQSRHGFHVVTSPYQFVYRPYSTGISRRFLFDNWFLTAGDLDFT